jgi:hypothetical protein
MLFIIMAIFFQYEIGQFSTSTDDSFSGYEDLIAMKQTGAAIEEI